VALALALGSALLWLAATAPAGGRLSVTFLDVGQGDAILVRGPQGHTILVDGSPSGEAVVNALGRHLPFWDDSLDAVVLTHPDADHLTGLLAVLDRYDVQAVLAGPTEADSTQYQTWRRLIAEKGVPYRQARSGDSIDLGRGARILVLHPPPAPLAGTDNDVNNNSLVLRLTMGRTSILLTADLEAEGEFSLLAESTSLRSVALQVPHHGSRSSSTPELLRDVQPLVALISVGADNRFGHPVPEVLARLPAKLIYRTDRYGDITISSDGRKLWVETQQAP
jgi:competence protein ComEC